MGLYVVDDPPNTGNVFVVGEGTNLASSYKNLHQLQPVTTIRWEQTDNNDATYEESWEMCVLSMEMMECKDDDNGWLDNSMDGCDAYTAAAINTGEKKCSSDNNYKFTTSEMCCQCGGGSYDGCGCVFNEEAYWNEINDMFFYYEK